MKSLLRSLLSCKVNHIRVNFSMFLVRIEHSDLTEVL